MANEEHLAILRQGVNAWNAWREKEPRVRPDLRGAYLWGSANLRGANLRGVDLSEANLKRVKDYTGMEDDLSGANLREANLSGVDISGMDLRVVEDLSGANLSGANLSWANLSGVDLRGVDLRGAQLSRVSLDEANLRGANLSGMNLRGVDLRVVEDLSGVDLSGANLFGANLSGATLDRAHLPQANLVDACLDHANLTGVRLWETQHGGWSIKGVICQHAFWDREGQERIEYREGEFERIFAEKPRIVLRYPGGMSPIELFALPLVVQRLQSEHPDSVLQVRSVQNDAGGASVTITIEDLAGRDPEAFGQALVRIQTRLECVVEERDRLQQRLDSIVTQAFSEIGKFMALPRQEIHVHRPSGLTAIEGPTMSKGDTYNIPGQAGAVGPSAHAHDNTFQQIQVGIDLPKLAEELGRLRAAMKGESKEPELWISLELFAVE